MNGFQFYEKQGEVSLVILQGASGSVSFSVAADLTGYSATFTIAKGYKLEPVLLLSTEVEVGGVVITPGQSTSTIVLSPTAEQTALITDNFSGRYDLEITSPDDLVTRVIWGSVSISPKVAVYDN
jgi:hypothetical protein